MPRPYYPQVWVRVNAIVQKSRSSQETEPVVFTVTPRSTTITRNDYNTADEIHLEFDAKRFPIMPRNIRQARVDVYTADGGAISGSERGEVLDPKNCRYTGWIDVPEIDYSETDHKITWKGRDFTGLLIDFKPIGLDVVPYYFDDSYTALRRLLDHVNCEDMKLQLVGLDAWPKLNTTAPPNIGNARLPTRSEDSAWMMVKRICDHVNLIPQVKLDTLVVGTSRGLTVPTSTGAFIYGNNVTEYKEQRILKKIREGIALRAYCMAERRYLIARFPPTGDSRVKVHTPKYKPRKGFVDVDQTIDVKEKYRWFPYPAVANVNVLLDSAERIYNERSHQEFDGHLKCSRMMVLDAASSEEDSDKYGDSAGTFDVMGLSSGDRIAVDVVPEHRQALGDFFDSQSRVSYLEDNGYGSEVAVALVRAYENGIDGPMNMYVRKATHVFNESYELQLDFQNLIDAGEQPLAI